MEGEIWNGKVGRAVGERKSRKGNPGREIWERESRKRNPGRGIWEEKSRKGNQGRGIQEGESGNGNPEEEHLGRTFWEEKSLEMLFEPRAKTGYSSSYIIKVASLRVRNNQHWSFSDFHFLVKWVIHVALSVAHG